MSVELLDAFAQAFNRHDIEALLAMVTADCVFEMATGPEACGRRHQGKAALRQALPWAWQHWPDARWEDATHVMAGARGFSEWTFRGTDAAGRMTEVRGVDLFEIRDGLIARKDTYRKQGSG